MMASASAPYSASTAACVPSTSWTYLSRIPFRSRQRASSTPLPTTSMNSHPVMIVDDVIATTATTMPPPVKLEGREKNIKLTVRNLMRLASHSLRSGNHEKRAQNQQQRDQNRSRNRTGKKAVPGDNESGIVLDEGDVDDSYYLSNAKQLDPVLVLPAEITDHIFSYLDHKTLVNCESVARRWQSAALNRHVWRSVFRNEVGNWDSHPRSDWKRMFAVNNELHDRWKRGQMSSRYMKGHTDAVYCVQFDDTKVITGSRDRTIRVWDIKSGECTNILSRTTCTVEGSVNQYFHTASVLCLQFDDEILVTGSSDNTCIVWSLPTYTQMGRLVHHKGGVLDVCFNEKYIVSCSKDTTICIWNRNTRRLIRQLKGHRGPVNAVVIRGNKIVSASGDALIKLWDIETGECIRIFKGHHRGLACVQFSEDAKTIVSGGNDQDIRVWDAETGECLKLLKGHKNLVRTLYLDSRNRRIISGSYDTSVKVWDLDKGNMILDITQVHSAWILAAKADYKRIVSASQDSRTLMLDFGVGVNGIEILAPTPKTAAAQPIA